MVALYLTERAETLAPSTLNRRMAAISVRHQEHGLDSPTHHPEVRAVLTGIRRTKGTAAREVYPASIGEVRRMVAHLPATTIGIRDKALLLVGFAGALRRSELVALNVGDLKTRDEGIRVRLRRSKTDQERKGREGAVPDGTGSQTCPVSALRLWLNHAEITRGAGFRSVDRHGKRLDCPPSDRAVANIVKRAAEGAGARPRRVLRSQPRGRVRHHSRCRGQRTPNRQPDRAHLDGGAPAPHPPRVALHGQRRDPTGALRISGWKLDA